MKKLVTAVALAVAFALGVGGAAEAQHWKKVRIGTEGAYPPFNFIDKSGQLKGFDIDIGNALCARMKVECSFVAQDWDGIIPALLAKKYDAIVASMSITEERLKKVSFTQYYYRTPGRFVTKKGAGLDLSPAGMKGKTIGAQRQTTHSSYLEDNYMGAKLKFYGTQDEANLDLVSGRLDAVLADGTVLYDWLQTKDGKVFEFVGEPVSDAQWYGAGEAIAIRKENKELLQMFNAALDEIFADGTFAKINAQYFPFSIR